MHSSNIEREILVPTGGIIEGPRGLNPTPGTKICINDLLSYNNPQICVAQTFIISTVSIIYPGAA